MSRKPQIDPEFRVEKFCDFFFRIPGDRSEFARQLGVSDSTVAHWEAGERFPTAENITRICRTTGTRADDLLQIPKDCRNAPDIKGTTAEKIAQLIHEAGLTNAEAARVIFRTRASRRARRSANGSSASRPHSRQSAGFASRSWSPRTGC